MTSNSMEHEGSNTRRLDRVETEVAEIRGEIRGIATAILDLKEGFKSWQSREDSRAFANRPNVVAIAAVLFSLISALIGGAWVIGGSIARFDERDLMRDRELARMHASIDRLEQRQWSRANGTEGTQQ